MRHGSISVSKRHGVNPSLDMCFVCGEAKGVVLFGRMQGDQEAPRSVVTNHEPCDKCKEWMSNGIVMISIRTGEEPSDNPYRTGGWCVLKDEAFVKVFSGDVAEATLKRRMCFIDDQTWDAVGLPRENIPAKESAS